MSRELKDILYEQVARVGKALSSPKRLEILELLAQGEKTVEVLANEAAIDIKLASAHLRVLKESRIVEVRRDGRFMAYRLAGEDVAGLWANLHAVATEHLVELQIALARILSGPERLTEETRISLLDKARQGDVVVLDVRPETEYQTGHLPHARSIPISELKRRLAELPKDKEIVAYCRGPFCLMSNEAVALLKKRGFKARKIGDGVAEWAAAGLPIENEA
ncbi:ArsR/SmtB family transcription factor [Sulfurisoma sediminicola]|uniref:ArsR family transcriptional regulator n=1 Tax=Sulfurisoma sediminicola TaxID=1381557 RepID=A0A497XEA2_9PROT|nr:metalloregulator ArsR/SmtB family transcription factor [Sulfurisoma sediminicola]RLJ65039.1 ArsR family transcriptional regulator [Sulfurisoma sediminicola]